MRFWQLIGWFIAALTYCWSLTQQLFDWGINLLWFSCLLYLAYLLYKHN